MSNYINCSISIYSSLYPIDNNQKDTKIYLENLIYKSKKIDSTRD